MSTVDASMLPHRVHGTPRVEPRIVVNFVVACLQGAGQEGAAGAGGQLRCCGERHSDPATG